MPIISCPDCGQDVSDQAKVCPACGYPIDKYRAKKSTKELLDAIGYYLWWQRLGVFIVIAIVVLEIYLWATGDTAAFHRRLWEVLTLEWL